MTVRQYLDWFGLDSIQLKVIGYSKQPTRKQSQGRVGDDNKDICTIANFITPDNGGTLYRIEHKELYNQLWEEWEKNQESYLPPELAKKFTGQEKVFICPIEAFVKFCEMLPSLFGTDDTVIFHG